MHNTSFSVQGSGNHWNHLQYIQDEQFLCRLNRWSFCAISTELQKSIMYHQVGEYRMNVFIQSMVSSDENYSKTTLKISYFSPTLVAWILLFSYFLENFAPTFLLLFQPRPLEGLNVIDLNFLFMICQRLTITLIC